MENEKAACYKFFASVILIVAFITLLVFLRAAVSLPSQAPPLGFRDKWYNSCNLVVAGDSRTHLAVDPDQLVVSTIYKGVNFCFGGNALSEQYLDKITTLLCPNDPRVILLGITPHMFAPHAFKDNAFLCYQPPTVGERLFSWFFGNKWPMFLTTTISEIRSIITGGKYQPPIRVIISSNGWSAAYCRIPDDESTELESYNRHFQLGPVIPSVLDMLFERVKRWSSDDIIVIGFRPPTTEKMCNLENRFSGFNESDFIGRFEMAGGNWIKVPQYGVYRCYDGSHITADAAQELSHYLSQEICSRFPQLQATLCSR
jgi:hypothetical protein